jgi:hypothetical protein
MCASPLLRPVPTSPSTTPGVPARAAALLDHPAESRPRAVACWVTLGASVIVSAFAILHACLETETFFETIRSWQQLRG